MPQCHSQHRQSHHLSTDVSRGAVVNSWLNKSRRDSTHSRRSENGRSLSQITLSTEQSNNPELDSELPRTPARAALQKIFDTGKLACGTNRRRIRTLAEHQCRSHIPVPRIGFVWRSRDIPRETNETNSSNAYDVHVSAFTHLSLRRFANWKYRCAFFTSLPICCFNPSTEGNLISSRRRSRK